MENVVVNRDKNEKTKSQGQKSTPPLSPSPLHRRLTTRQSNTSAALASRAEHRCVPVSQISIHLPSILPCCLARRNPYTRAGGGAYLNISGTIKNRT